MQSKILIQESLATITFVTLLPFFIFLTYFFPKGSLKDYEKSASLNIVPQLEIGRATSTRLARYGLPLRLRIPSIGLNSSIEQVSITKGGAMDTPKILEDVAWYRLGTRPGKIGSAVISGHYGWKDGKVSAFDKLFTIKIGDKVLVQNDKGVTISFVVREIRKYNPDADTKDIFSSSDGIAHLNLITCNGIWNKEEKRYSDRLVVFTDREVTH